jgi:hypothetical protein
VIPGKHGLQFGFRDADIGSRLFPANWKLSGFGDVHITMAGLVRDG